MKKKFYTMLVLLACLLPSGLYAQGETMVEVHYLVVSLDDGSESKFALTENPMVTFDRDTLAVTNGNDMLKFDMEGVADYHFVKEKVTVVSVEKPTVESDADVSPTLAFGEAKFSGLKAGTRIMVYSIDGQVVDSVTASADGQATIDLRRLSKGVYILRTPGKSFKIFNK